MYTYSQRNDSTTNGLCSECVAQIFDLDDTSFDLVIFENIYGTVNFDADRLVNLCFNPLDYLYRASNRISPSTAKFRDFLSQTTQTPLEPLMNLKP